MEDKQPRIVRWEHFHNFDNIENADEDVYLADSDSDEFERPPNNIKVLPVAITPVGPVPISNESVSSSFNLWILHSNFKITKQDVRDICAVDGIEAVTVFSRYRLRILIAELFSTDEVMNNVEEKLGCEVNFSKDIELTDELVDRIELVRDKLKKEGHYLIYVLPNGQLKSFSSKELGKELHSHIHLFQSVYESVGGYLMVSPGIFS